MSSTRNKNSQSEYKLQVQGNRFIDNFTTYTQSTTPVTTLFAGNGIIMPHIGRDQLSYSSIDHESYLFGINSTNLVNPQPQFTPKIKQLKSLNMIKTPQLIMPQPNLFDNIDNERPLIYKQ
jgi:hypothetical protein